MAKRAPRTSKQPKAGLIIVLGAGGLPKPPKGGRKPKPPKIG